MSKQKTVSGLTIDYQGKTISNIISLYIDAYDKGELVVNYMENEYTTVNMRCKLSECTINTK